jgi:YhcG PDDEXK nuclease domain
MKDFLLELGRDFCFAGSEYPLQVGKRDFALDLLFYHRGLNALVAIELKVGPFEPEYLPWPTMNATASASVSRTVAVVSRWRSKAAFAASCRW